MISKLVVKNLREFRRDLDTANNDRVKAAQTAARVEAYRLRNLLKQELRQGKPGGQTLAPLSEIARRNLGKFSKSLRKKDRPLIKSRDMSLADIIRYRTEKTGKDRMVISVGFVDPNTGTPLSKSWKRLAEKHQEGFETPVSDKLRRLLRNWGAGLSKRSPARKMFFLKQSTTRLKTPARPIIEPFWEAHQAEAQRNIAQNFARKMAGERI